MKDIMEKIRAPNTDDSELMHFAGLSPTPYIGQETAFEDLIVFTGTGSGRFLQ